MADPVGAMPPPDGVTPNFAHPQDVLHTINTVIGILAICLIGPFVLLRLYIRLCITRTFAREDWFCLVAWLLATGYCLTGLFMGFHGGGFHGGGFHDYEITKQEFVGFNQALYADTIVYGLTAWFTKATLLLIFAKIFAPFEKTVVGIYIFMAVMLCYYFPVMIIKIKICTPIQALWDPSVEANCFDQSTLFVFDTIMSAATDLAILLLPIPLVWSLHMSFRKKLRIGILLGTGGIATGASIVRLILVFQPDSFADKTVSFVRFNLLGVVEVGIGLICASFPAFNVFLGKLSPSHPRSKIRRTPQNSNGVRLQNMPNNIPRTKVENERKGVGITSLMRDSTYVDLENGSEPNVLLSHAQRHSGAGFGDSKMSDTLVTMSDQTFVSSRSRVESSYPADEAMPYEPPASSKLDNESWSKRTWGDHEITWGEGSESSSIERIKTLEGELERSWSITSGIEGFERVGGDEEDGVEVKVEVELGGGRGMDRRLTFGQGQQGEGGVDDRERWEEEGRMESGNTYTGGNAARTRNTR